jgi:hypothetical protein
MDTGRTETLLDHLRRVLPSDPDDAALLGRFLAVRDEEAFAALVRRSCRNLATDSLGRLA